MPKSEPTAVQTRSEPISRYAEMLSAMGAEPRLRIMRLLLSALPEGMVAGDLQAELDIPGSTLSHHLDKLKSRELVTVRRKGTYLWYTVNTDALRDLLTFLYAECCTRNQAVKPQSIVGILEGTGRRSFAGGVLAGNGSK